MPRICFVIMPFSGTKSCTDEKWTWIFENVFKPAVESAGLDYECRRSVATRGNIVAAILEDLKNAYVVVADLTDRNANVFYELGVRHTLTDRTIMVSQKSEDIPFDLKPYAYHVYDWKTDKGRTELAEKMRQLLSEVDANPQRHDNPVSDFLGRAVEPVQTSEPVRITPAEAVIAQPLVGTGAEGLDAAEFARRLAKSGTAADLNSVFRLTRTELRPLIKRLMDTLDKRGSRGQIQESQIPVVALEYIKEIEPNIPNIWKVEEFVFACVEQYWVSGTQLGLRLAGDLISLGELIQGPSVRFVKGLPELLASRLLILIGAKAMTDEAFSSLEVILREPIEVERRGAKFSYLPFPKHRDLFWPEAFLGHANHWIQYISGLWQTHPHLHKFFDSEEDYHLAVGQFLMIVALVDARHEGEHPLYPGYRFLPQVRRAMAKLCVRLSKSEAFLKGIAKAFGESPEGFRNGGSGRAERANSAELGSSHLSRTGVRFPNPMDAGIDEW